MPKINELQILQDILAGDLVPFYSQSNGDTYTISTNNLALAIQSLIAINDDIVTQYKAPSSTGFSIQINDDSDSVWIILTPTGTLASGTLVFPIKSKCLHKQEIIVNSTQTITSLSGNGNGANLVGFPTTLVANSYFKMKYDIITGTWYRIG